jgi:large subunit ribosomal protein L25
MKSEITVSAQPREGRGKNEARRLRASGMAPAIVYGGGAEPIAVAVNPKEVNKILHSGTGSNTIFNIDFNGQQAPVMIVDWQYDPIKSRLLHLDLQRIDMNKRMIVNVPVVTSGEPRGVKEQGGIYELVTREVQIECLPGDIPDQFSVDVTGLMLNQSLRAGDLPIAGSMRLVTTPDTVISHVVTARAEPTAEPAAPVAAAPAEPEVIKKGKKEEERAAAEDKGAKKK